MEYIIMDKKTGTHLARQKNKPTKEYLIFWCNQGFMPIVKKEE